MMARSLMLQLEAGYIDARPLTANSSKSSCYARPDHTLGHKQTFAESERKSALPPKADFRVTHRHVCFGPILLKKSESGAKL